MLSNDNKPFAMAIGLINWEGLARSDLFKIMTLLSFLGTKFWKDWIEILGKINSVGMLDWACSIIWERYPQYC